MSLFPTSTGDLLEERKRRLKQLSRKAAREDILNCFTPNKVIDNAVRFVGREEAIKAALSGLVHDGMSLLLWGERGCGKSSLAFMIQQVAGGNSELLNYYGLSDYLRRKGVLAAFLEDQQRRYNVIWVNADPEMNIDELCREILYRNDDGVHGPGLRAYVEKLPDEEEISGTLGVDAPFKAAVGGKAVFKTEKPASAIEALRRTFERYGAENDEELLIVIDEFDTLKDRTKLTPLLKNVRRVRFLLAGVGSSASDLLASHASIPRHVRSVSLKPMERIEMYALLEVGFHQLGRFFKLGASAADAIVHAVDGSPFWCHLIARTIVEQNLDGYGSFPEFLKLADKIELGLTDIRRAISVLPTHPDAQLYEDWYSNCTLSDANNERILLQIARRPERRYATSSITQSVANDLGLHQSEIKRALRNMLDLKGGPFERGETVGNSAPFAFRDPNFRRYVLLRDRSLTT